MKENGLKVGIVMVMILVIGLSLGYYFGKTDSSDVVTDTQSAEEISAIETPADMNDDSSSDSNQGSVSDTVPEEGIKVDSATLSDGQAKVLETLGVDTENIVLTPEMIACAEAKVGSDRLAEIQDGASPSVLEGASLVACYRQ